MFAVNVQGVSVQQLHWNLINWYIPVCSSFAVANVVNILKINIMLLVTLRDVLMIDWVLSVFLIHTFVCNHMPWVFWRCWLSGRNGIQPVKNEWWGAGVGICLGWGADLPLVQLMPLHPLSLASVKSRLDLVLWYRVTWVVPAKGPLNGCCCCCCCCCCYRQHCAKRKPAGI